MACGLSPLARLTMERRSEGRGELGNRPSSLPKVLMAWLYSPAAVWARPSASTISATSGWAAAALCAAESADLASLPRRNCSTSIRRGIFSLGAASTAC